LCDALVGLGRVGTIEGVEVAISWSRNRPPKESAHTRYLFSPDMVPVIEEASRLLKENAPREDVDIEGFVIELYREEGALSGGVAVSALVDEDLRKIAIELKEQEYAVMVNAHAGKKRIRCNGDVVKQGREIPAVKSPPSCDRGRVLILCRACHPRSQLAFAHF